MGDRDQRGASDSGPVSGPKARLLHPGGESFKGREVESGDRLDASVSRLVVASQWWPEICIAIAYLGFDMPCVEVWTESHEDLPLLRVDPSDVLARRDEYLELAAVIRALEDEIPDSGLSRLDFLEHALLQAPSGGIALEFGVFRGESLNVIAKHRPVVGFDSSPDYLRTGLHATRRALSALTRYLRWMSVPNWSLVGSTTPFLSFSMTGVAPQSTYYT